MKLLTRSTISPDPLVPVNGPGPSMAVGGTRRARCNGMYLLPLSRFSMAGTTTTYRPRSVPSPYASGLPTEAVPTIRPMARRDDPKGKRPQTTSANDERSLAPISRRCASVPPSPSDLDTAEPESDDDYKVTVAGDIDDYQSSHTTAPSASLGTLETSRKRWRRNSTVDDSRTRSATTRRVH